MKKTSKRLLALTCMAIMFAANSTMAYASNVENVKTPTAEVTITDPQTNEEWKWNVEVPEENILMYSTYDADGQEFGTAVAEIELGDMLLASYPDSRSEIGGIEVKATVGLDFIVDPSRNTLALTRVFGTYEPMNSLYYIYDRTVLWANSGGFDHNEVYPTSNSWSYKPDTTPCAYESSTLAPYALTECWFGVGGMSGAGDRQISVRLLLDWL